MNNMGVHFKIPNEYGKFLYDLLVPIKQNEYIWLVDNDEIHIIEEDKFTNEFLFKDNKIMEGHELYNVVNSRIYYLVFVTLRAFSKQGKVLFIKDYKEFLESDCEIIISVVDCSYVMIWCKDRELLSNIYNYALLKDFGDVSYISQNDLIQNKYYID